MPRLTQIKPAYSLNPIIPGGGGLDRTWGLGVCDYGGATDNEMHLKTVVEGSFHILFTNILHSSKQQYNNE